MVPSCHDLLFCAFHCWGQEESDSLVKFLCASFLQEDCDIAIGISRFEDDLQDLCEYFIEYIY